MSKAKILAGAVSAGGVLADGAVSAAEVSGLAAVATSGAYGDLSGKPSLPAGAIVGTTDTQTLAGKTIDIASNTLTGVQPTLISGTSIKTINSTSLLGAGDVAIQTPLVSGTNIKTVGGASLLGSGDLTVGGGSLIFISSATASLSATIDVEGFSANFDNYIVFINNIEGGSSILQGRLKFNGTYQGSGYTSDSRRPEVSGTTITRFTTTNGSQMNLLELGKTGSQPYSGSIEILGANSNQRKCLLFRFFQNDGSDMQHWVGAANYFGTDFSLSLQGFRLFLSGANMSSGTISLYGIKKS